MVRQSELVRGGRLILVLVAILRAERQAEPEARKERRR